MARELKWHRGYGSNMGERATVVCGLDAPVKFITLVNDDVTCLLCIAEMKAQYAKAVASMVVVETRGSL